MSKILEQMQRYRATGTTKGLQIQRKIMAGRETSENIMPWAAIYSMYKNAIDAATELQINPENGHAVFEANEGAVTPIISDFLGGIVGTDEQIKNYFKRLYPEKNVLITRSRYI